MGLSRTERAALIAIAIVTAAAGVCRYASGVPNGLTFAFATIALVTLAWLVSFAVENVGEHFGPSITGVLQATLGNLPEFFVVIFALQAGQLVIAQTAILGSILVNALLVLGLVIVVGARRAPDGVMRFGSRLPNDTATLLLISTLIIILIGLSSSSHDAASHHVRAISIIGAVAILVVYLSWLVPYLRAPSDPAAQAAHRLSLSTGIGLLVAGGVGSAFVSDWFVHALQPTIHALHISKAFAGLVIVAIAGNGVEHAVGIVLAYRKQADLAISVVKNSVAQIAAFLYPAMVLISLLLATRLTFSLAPVYIGALAGTAIIVWQITGDGEATIFEGVALVAAFVILATVAAYEA
ncbi:MAG: Ca2+:H+ antiporter [Solirubrobacteraceae bacterium]|nr:Ca2+:H+ antiporter [Solirubrobacteraceae bacterium]